MTRTVNILDLDSLVPYMTEAERKKIVESIAAGYWTLEMEEDRYDDLWVQSRFHNADVIAETENAMRKSMHKP